MKIVGKTTDGKLVVSGLFKIVDTEGLPLDYVLRFLDKHNMVLGWLEFFLEARQHGWPVKTILSKSIGAVHDAYGKSEQTTELENRIRLTLEPFL